jgi:guanylate kinase
LAAPSGVGKTTIARALLASRSDLGFSISATTRAQRPNETPAKDYFFLTRDEFARREAAGDFAEAAEYAGNRYGTLKSEVDRIRGAGRNVLLDIEIQGAALVRKRYPPPQSLAIFLLPPSAEVLVTRLRGRGTEAHSTLLHRLEIACAELLVAEQFDHVVVNDHLETAVAEVSAVIDGRAPRLARHEIVQRVERLRTELLATVERLKQTQLKGTT